MLDDRLLYWATFSETTQGWNPQQEVGENFASVFGPALAVFQDKMYMAWRGAKDDSGLYWTTFNGTTQTWNPRQDLSDRGSAKGPALVAVRDKLFMFWRGIDHDARIYFATFDGQGNNPQWTPQQLVNPELNSIDSPSVAIFRGEIYIAYSPTYTLFGENDPDVAYNIVLAKFDGTIISNYVSGAAVGLLAFPEVTNSLKSFLLRQGFDPQQGTRQAGTRSLRHLMGLSQAGP